jgi:hypothetical protein
VLVCAVRPVPYTTASINRSEGRSEKSSSRPPADDVILLFVQSLVRHKDAGKLLVSKIRRRCYRSPVQFDLRRWNVNYKRDCGGRDFVDQLITATSTVSAGFTSPTTFIESTLENGISVQNRCFAQSYWRTQGFVRELVVRRLCCRSDAPFFKCLQLE